MEGGNLNSEEDFKIEIEYIDSPLPRCKSQVKEGKPTEEQVFKILIVEAVSLVAKLKTDDKEVKNFIHYWVDQALENFRKNCLN